MTVSCCHSLKVASAKWRYDAGRMCYRGHLYTFGKSDAQDRERERRKTDIA